MILILNARFKRNTKDINIISVLKNFKVIDQAQEYCIGFFPHININTKAMENRKWTRSTIHSG